MSTALLCVAVLAYFAPEHLAGWLGGTQAAWQYVLSGVEAASLWAVVGVLSSAPSLRALCAWGVAEAAQRPMCRLAFPLDRAPQLLPGQTLCDAAFQFPMSFVSVLAALFVAAMHQEASHAATTHR